MHKFQDLFYFETLALHTVATIFLCPSFPVPFKQCLKFPDTVLSWLPRFINKSGKKTHYRNTAKVLTKNCGQPLNSPQAHSNHTTAHCFNLTLSDAIYHFNSKQGIFKPHITFGPQESQFVSFPLEKQQLLTFTCAHEVL